ncbi:hypothetical protein AB4Z42_05440 [Mycobacterium sp. 2YAF39]|uniref:hypothetical protein n=1 Tax=Mycobacterium sp. 2YAF39 TaxID=3233033 RepID=UPI003F9AE594
MSLVESIERGLAWLSTPRWIPGRMEMETRRGKRLELEIISFTVRVPVPGGAKLTLPVFVAILPVGSSPIEGTHVRSEQGE